MLVRHDSWNTKLERSCDRRRIFVSPPWPSHSSVPVSVENSLRSSFQYPSAAAGDAAARTTSEASVSEIGFTVKLPSNIATNFRGAGLCDFDVCQQPRMAQVGNFNRKWLFPSSATLRSTFEWSRTG